MESLSLHFFPIVDDLPDISPINFLSLPPEQNIEFVIDLVLVTWPISIGPYHMAPCELKELNSQLIDNIIKGLIRMSMSLWGDTILFGEKKDGSMHICIVYR